MAEPLTAKQRELLEKQLARLDSDYDNADATDCQYYEAWEEWRALHCALEICDDYARLTARIAELTSR